MPPGGWHGEGPDEVTCKGCSKSGWEAGHIAAAASAVSYNWAIRRKERNKRVHAANGNATGSGGGADEQCRPRGAPEERQAEAPTRHGGTEPWSMIGNASAWDAATSVRSVDLELAASVGTSFRSAAPAMPAVPQRGNECSPSHMPPGQASTSPAMTGTAATEALAPPGVAAAANDHAGPLPQLPPGAAPRHTVDASSAVAVQCAGVAAARPPGTSGDMRTAVQEVASQHVGTVMPKAVPAQRAWSDWPAALKAWGEEAMAASAAQQPPPPRAAGSSSDWAGSELWCEVRSNEPFCLLCMKFATDAHLQSQTHKQRRLDTAGWLQWQREAVYSQEQRALAVERAAAQSAVVPWAPPAPVAARRRVTMPRAANSGEGPPFHIDIGFDILGRRDAWDSTRMHFSTSKCTLAVQSQHTPACLATGCPLLSISSAPCFATGEGSHLTVQFGGALRLCTATAVPEDEDHWGGERTPRAAEHVRLPGRAEAQPVQGVAPVPDTRAQPGAAEIQPRLECATMYPHARVYHGLDYPDTPPAAWRPIGAAERPVDGLRDSIETGVPAMAQVPEPRPRPIAFHVQGHGPIYAAWRQYATLGELFLEAIRSTVHLNPALSVGIMQRLRFVLGGIH